MSFPEPGATYTLSTYEYINAITVDGNVPGTPITTTYLAPPGKGSGPQETQIWQGQQSNYGFMFLNPSTQLVLQVQDDDTITGEVMAGPKDYQKLQYQCWRPKPDPDNPGAYL